MHVFITAGDPSGDAHAANLMAQLRLIVPGVRYIGFGGPEMEMQGLHSIARIKDLAVTGFWEVAKRYSYFRALLNQCDGILSKHRPQLFIPVDYPGFNLRLAQKARQKNIPVAWYIAPQLWAWGKNRAHKLAHVTTLLLAVFPFEKEFFGQFGIDTHWVGHPLLDQLDFDAKPRVENMALVLPGSRKNEVQHHVPLLVEMMKNLRHEQLDVQFARAKNIEERFLAPLTDAGGTVVTNTREAMSTSSGALIKAGTSTLEAALLGLPFSTFYKTSALSYAISKRLVNVNSVTMANLLLERNLVREFIQSDATATSLAKELITVCTDEHRKKELTSAFEEVRRLLGGPGAAQRAAETIAEVCSL